MYLNTRNIRLGKNEERKVLEKTKKKTGERMRWKREKTKQVEELQQNLDTLRAKVDHLITPLAHSMKDSVTRTS